MQSSGRASGEPGHGGATVSVTLTPRPLGLHRTGSPTRSGSVGRFPGSQSGSGGPLHVHVPLTRGRLASHSVDPSSAPHRTLARWQSESGGSSVWGGGSAREGGDGGGLLAGSDPLWVSGRPNDDLLNRLKVYVGDPSPAPPRGLKPRPASQPRQRPGTSPARGSAPGDQPGAPHVGGLLAAGVGPGPAPARTPLQAFLNLSALKAAGQAHSGVSTGPAAPGGAGEGAMDSALVQGPGPTSRSHAGPVGPSLDTSYASSLGTLDPGGPPPALPDAALPLTDAASRYQLLREARRTGVTAEAMGVGVGGAPGARSRSPNPHLGPRGLPASPRLPTLPDTGAVVRSPGYREALVMAAMVVTDSPAAYQRYMALHTGAEAMPSLPFRVPSRPHSPGAAGEVGGAGAGVVGMPGEGVGPWWDLTPRVPPALPLVEGEDGSAGDGARTTGSEASGVEVGGMVSAPAPVGAGGVVDGDGASVGPGHRLDNTDASS